MGSGAGKQLPLERAQNLLLQSQSHTLTGRSTRRDSWTEAAVQRHTEDVAWNVWPARGSSSNKPGLYWVDKPILSVSGWKCKVWLAIKVPFKPLGHALLLENVVPTKQREKRAGASYPYGASSKGLCLRPYICSNKRSLTLPVLSSFYKQGNEALKILSILLKVI